MTLLVFQVIAAAPDGEIFTVGCMKKAIEEFFNCRPNIGLRVQLPLLRRITVQPFSEHGADLLSALLRTSGAGKVHGIGQNFANIKHGVCGTIAPIRTPHTRIILGMTGAQLDKV